MLSDALPGCKLIGYYILTLNWICGYKVIGCLALPP